jgi:hypothetical protein
MSRGRMGYRAAVGVGGLNEDDGRDGLVGTDT